MATQGRGSSPRAGPEPQPRPSSPVHPAASDGPSGDGAAGPVGFEECYLGNYDRLIVQLYAYTADMAQAQDVVQEAFARALPRWSRLATYDDPVAWVRRVAWNLATSRWRQVRSLRLFASRHREEHASEPSPDRVAISRALATLPTNQRRAVVLHYLADLAVVEIARQEGVAEGTIKSWLYHGRIALAAILDTPGTEHRHG
jgi:RNA polymerase sigma-70 factor, ECF subfamily